MADGEYEYVENTDKRWTSTYSHQRRPDVTARAAKMIPRDRLVTKKGRYFTTNTSQQRLEDEIDRQEERREVQARYAQQEKIDSKAGGDPMKNEAEVSKPSQRFMAKNSSFK